VLPANGAALGTAGLAMIVSFRQRCVTNILSNEMADALSDVCARTHRVGGLLPRLAAAGGRLARGLAAGGVWGGQERWLLAKRRPFYHPNPVTKKGQPFNG
jgi:hypothetical protein